MQRKTSRGRDMLERTEHFRRSLPSYLGGVVVGTLVAFPAASVDPGDARQTQLALIDLEGLVFHHAPSSQSCLQSANIPLMAKRILRTSDNKERFRVCRVKILTVCSLGT